MRAAQGKMEAGTHTLLFVTPYTFLSFGEGVFELSRRVKLWKLHSEEAMFSLSLRSPNSSARRFHPHRKALSSSEALRLNLCSEVHFYKSWVADRRWPFSVGRVLLNRTLILLKAFLPTVWSTAWSLQILFLSCSVYFSLILSLDCLNFRLQGNLLDGNRTWAEGCYWLDLQRRRSCQPGSRLHWILSSFCMSTLNQYYVQGDDPWFLFFIFFSLSLKFSGRISWTVFIGFLFHVKVRLALFYF